MACAVSLVAWLAAVSVSLAAGSTAQPTRDGSKRITKAGTKIKPTWSGQFTGVGGLGPIELDVSFNLPDKHFQINQIISVPFHAGRFTWNTFYGDDVSGWTRNISMNASMCFPDNIPWPRVLHDFGFGWLDEASHNGTDVVAGKLCQVWVFAEEQRYDWSACVDDDGFPRRFSITAHAEEVGSSMAGYLTFSASLMNEPKITAKPIVTEEICASWPQPLCPGHGIQTMYVYRDTSMVSPAPGNRNGCDAKGQGFTAFVYKSQYVALYEVSHNTSYGQYAMCNYIKNRGVGNHCMGGGKTIGRAPLFHVCGGKPQCGQCTPNSDTGNWLSFPQEGMCATGEEVGTDGCTWNATLKKVVNYSCVMDNATKAICARSFSTHDDACKDAFEHQVAGCPAVESLSDIPLTSLLV